MIKEFKCRWPTGTETLSVGPGYSACAGAPSVRVGMATGAAVLSVHLHAQDAVAVAQAVAVERSKLVGIVRRYDCNFFRESPITIREDSDLKGGIELRVQGALCYLTRSDARSLAMDILAMTADEA